MWKPEGGQAYCKPPNPSLKFTKLCGTIVSGGEGSPSFAGGSSIDEEECSSKDESPPELSEPSLEYVDPRP